VKHETDKDDPSSLMENQEIEPELESPELPSGQSSRDDDDLSWPVSIPAFQGWKSGWDLEDLLLNPL
jgi:hypothetical protein